MQGNTGLTLMARHLLARAANDAAGIGSIKKMLRARNVRYVPSMQAMAIFMKRKEKGQWEMGKNLFLSTGR